MKKFALLMAAASVFGTAVMANNPAYNGFYLGLQAGPNVTTGKYRNDINGSGALQGNNSFSKSATSDFGRMGFAGGLFGGYGMTFSGNGYVGLEAYFNFDTTKVNVLNTFDQSTTGGLAQTGTLSSLFGKARLKRNFDYGLRLHLGYLFTKETLGYIILGAEAGKWKLTAWRGGMDAGALETAFTKNKTRVAFVPGVGVRHALSKNVFLKMEWTVSFNPKLSGTAPEINRNTNDVAGTNVKVKSLVQNTVMLGVGYKF